MDAPDATREQPAPGLVIWQPRRGFRYAADAFWLAGFALEGGPARTAIDLGTGSGVVAGLLAVNGVDALGVDVREEWAPLWARSRAESTVPLRFERRDVREVDGRYDLVVANPPYAPAGTGPASPDAWRAAARTETTARLDDFVAAALRCAPRACFVLPAEREREVTAIPGFGARRIARVGRRRVLVEIAAGEHPPMVEVLDESGAARWYTRARGVSSTEGGDA